ncbi:MAG: permease [Desulfobacterales bacterium]|nr:permease [Desulfobacterales bacterium]
MKNTFIFMGLMAALLIFMAGYQGGSSLIMAGFKNSGLTFVRVGPLAFLAFGVTGLVQGLVNPEVIRRWLGRDAGVKGILLGGLAGAFMPGGPYMFYPLAVTFLRSGAEIGAIIAFVAAKNLWSVMIITMEVALAGWPVFIGRFVGTLPFPIIMGLLANIFFPRAADDVRFWLDGPDTRKKEKGRP